MGDCGLQILKSPATKSSDSQITRSVQILKSLKSSHPQISPQISSAAASPQYGRISVCARAGYGQLRNRGMFDSLSTRLQDVFKSLRGEARLTPENIEGALREIRLALLEADVNFKVVKAFVDRVRDRAMGQDVLRALSPSQQVVKIVRDEMLALFGTTEGGLQPTNKRPRVILLLGLQGAGKTTTAGKLGMWLTKQGRHPLLVSTDVKRPAAIAQLNLVGQKAGVRVFDPAGVGNPVAR